MLNKDHRVLISLGCTMLGLSLACLTEAHAAKPIQLKVQSMKSVQSILAPKEDVSFEKISQVTDFQKVTHTRYQEHYKNYPVLGADVIVHSSTALGKADSINGVMYDGLQADLKDAPLAVFQVEQAKKAADLAQKAYLSRHKLAEMSAPTVKLMVYVDDQHKAHWAFLVNFKVAPLNGMPALPHYIMDAMSFHIYAEWDEIKTADETLGGGFGGNKKMGKLIYDGLKDHLPTLEISRLAKEDKCFLANGSVIVKDMRRRKDSDFELMSFLCKTEDPEHGGIYWDGDFDKVNGAFSPGNDALYAGKVIKEMYEKWYGVPPLVGRDGKPKMLSMRVHERMENAYWDGEQMTFGDGGNTFYPLTSLGVAAHEVSHGFTEQHSGLYYRDAQSGGLNESFSDMAAQAAEFYSTGKNSWEIGPEIFKKENEALRYMDEPTKDCHGQTPGTWCSISHMSQFNSHLDVHYTSGIFNKVFYLIGTAPDWNTRKAFDIMVKANMAYWRPKSTFLEAANCVLKATHDLEYNDAAVKAAFEAVGLLKANAEDCI